MRKTIGHQIGKGLLVWRYKTKQINSKIYIYYVIDDVSAQNNHGYVVRNKTDSDEI